MTAGPYRLQHRLITFDVEAMTGVCHRCGQVELRWPPRKRVKRPQCINRYFEERKYDAEHAKARRDETTLARKRELYHQKHWLVALANRYGISIDYYPEKLTEQGGVCAICKRDRPNEWGKYTLDHNHQTEAARGLLCGSCNSMLGYAEDDPQILLNAVEYLRAYN